MFSMGGFYLLGGFFITCTKRKQGESNMGFFEKKYN
jgi:hypothetical protein